MDGNEFYIFKNVNKKYYPWKKIFDEGFMYEIIKNQVFKRRTRCYIDSTRSKNRNI